MADEPEQHESDAHPDEDATEAAPSAEAPAEQPVAEEAPTESAEETAAPKRKRKPKTEAAEPQDADAPEPVAEAEETQAPKAEATPEPAAEIPAASAAAEESRSEQPAAEGAAGRAKPEIPGAHLEVDIVPEGADALGHEETEDPYAVGYEEEQDEAALEEREEPAGEEEETAQTIVSAAIDLAAGARYRATGKRKTAVARVILRPGGGEYTINGRSLAEYFPRATLQRNICQPLEAVGYQERMDVVARLHGGGVSSQAGALRHGISRALLEADPNLRGELKRRGFLTRDSRVKERKKAGLKKARKRPQFSKR